jgi:VLTF3-like late transcription factor
METASRQLQMKFEAARLVLAAMVELPVDRTTAGAITAMSYELSGLEIKFALSTSHLYISALAGETERLDASSEFARILAVEDFTGNVDRLVTRGESLLRDAGAPLRDDGAELKARRGGRGRGAPAAATPTRGGKKVPLATCAPLQRLLDSYPRKGACPSENGGEVAAVDYESCPACSGPTAVDAARSVLRCRDPACGAVSELVGIAFDDSQFYSQEGQKAKSGTFNPNRHFQFWWMHILAREPEEEIGDRDDPDNQYGEKLLDRLRTMVVRDNLILRLLTVYNVRDMLREVSRTDLNKNVPLLMKKLTGVGPPQVSDALAVRVENLFTKAIETGERIQRAGRVNRNYYPFYINKLVESLVSEEDTETRRILYYIYVQSKETVEEDDEDWEQICLELGEIEYKPTDRSLGQKYRPV